MQTFKDINELISKYVTSMNISSVYRNADDLQHLLFLDLNKAEIDHIFTSLKKENKIDISLWDVYRSKIFESGANIHVLRNIMQYACEKTSKNIVNDLRSEYQMPSVASISSNVLTILQMMHKMMESHLESKQYATIYEKNNELSYDISLAKIHLDLVGVYDLMLSQVAYDNRCNDKISEVKKTAKMIKNKMQEIESQIVEQNNELNPNVGDIL